jgi:spore coat polysaccharide biosynthesis protein SpsF
LEPTISIIQARMTSTRLPGKVLLDIAGKPMLQWVIDRASRASGIDRVVVATTSEPSDDPIAAFCQEHGTPVYRGSLVDVLDRYYQAALAFGAQTVVRLTADCPLVDPGVIDAVIELYRSSQPACDFAANRLPPPWKRTYPIGLDVEVCSLAALRRAWLEGQAPRHREHVMPYLYEEPGRFAVRVLDHTPDYGHLRWTVDTPRDLDLVREIVGRFGGRDDFSWLEVIELFQREPELEQINAQVAAKDYRETEGGKHA